MSDFISVEFFAVARPWRLAMESIDLQSMSLDELWALHETICLVLARKLETEKRSHEQRLNELRRRIGKASNETPERRPYRSIQNFEIQNRLTKHGPVVATSRVGCANCLRPEKPSTIYGLIGRSLAVVATADRPAMRLWPVGSTLSARAWASTRSPPCRPPRSTSKPAKSAGPPSSPI